MKKRMRKRIFEGLGLIVLVSVSMLYLQTSGEQVKEDYRPILESKVDGISKENKGEIGYVAIRIVNSYNMVCGMSNSLFDTWSMTLSDGSEDINNEILKLMYLWDNSEYGKVLSTDKAEIDYLMGSIDITSEMGKALKYMHSQYNALVEMTTRPNKDISSLYREVVTTRKNFEEAYKDLGVYIDVNNIAELSVPEIDKLVIEYASGVPSEEYPKGGLCGIMPEPKHTLEHLDIYLNFMNRAYSEMNDLFNKGELTSKEDIKDFMSVAEDAWWSDCSKTSVANSIQSNR